MSDLAGFTDEQISDRLALAGFHGVGPDEIANCRKDSTLLSDIETYGGGGFNMSNFPSKDTRSPEQKMRDIMPVTYPRFDHPKKTDAARKKRKAAKAARKCCRK